jgi:hypothetical protein
VPAFEPTALFGEARVLTRDGVVPPAMAQDLHDRLGRLEQPLRGETVATLALLHAARGDLRGAREMFESMCWLPARALSPEPLEFAFGWLLTDAAAQGDWARVRWLAREAGRPEAGGLAKQVVIARLAPQTELRRFFDELAQRALEAAPPAEDTTFLARLPYEAVRFAEQFSRAKPPPPPPEPALPADPMAAAITALLRLRDSSTLVSAAALADTVLTSTRLRDALMERATLLGGGSPDEALEELKELFLATLGGALDALPAAFSSLLRAAAARRRTALLESLDLRIDRLTDACEADTTAPMPDLWREFVTIRRDFDLAVALSDPGDRDMPHLVVVRLMRYFGTWLRLTKEEPFFAHAVFQFLEVEAHRAGDDKGARLAKASCLLCLEGS